MKHHLALCITGLLLLTGCEKIPASTNPISADVLLQNPLFAERYAEEMVRGLVELQIQNDPILEDEAKKQYADNERREWLKVAQEARRDQREGMLGNFIPMKEYAKGEVLSLNGTVHFSSLFEASPAPNLHVFVTTVVDPRDVDFPDESSLDLGPLQTPYGAQSYPLTEMVADEIQYRTVVLWETELNRLYAFAQLSPY